MWKTRLVQIIFPVKYSENYPQSWHQFWPPYTNSPWRLAKFRTTGSPLLFPLFFKKGNRNLPENYRPVSLTSVPSKILEHIICSHVRDHLAKHNVLTPLQNGFRGAHSCETQLLTTLQDLLYWRDRRVQVDVAVMDFAKAFDTVPHRSLLRKLEHYGLDTQLIGWINSFLIGRSQCVVVDGER